MFTVNLAIVSQSHSVSLGQLTKAAAAIQKQVTRDVRQEWDVDATVDAFERLKDVPLGYWQVVIRDQIPYPAQGIHLNKANGQPFALVKYSEEWTLTTSHECLEMLVDPSGNRLIAGDALKPEQGRVNYLVEVCDPCEASDFAYSVNGVIVSDFYTPHYFEPIGSAGVRYSYTGAIARPRQVLDGGYLTWWEPTSGHLWQLFMIDGQEEYVDHGVVTLEGAASMRRLSDLAAEKYRLSKSRPSSLAGPRRSGLVLSAMETDHSLLDASVEASANRLQEQIDAICKGV